MALCILYANSNVKKQTNIDVVCGTAVVILFLGQKLRNITHLLLSHF